MALALEPFRHDVADAFGEKPAEISPGAKPPDQGPDSPRVTALPARRRRDHGVETGLADLAGGAAVEVRAPLLEAS
ncbi:isochorismatase [Streptomyces sp. NPDC102402]|uniref:isochorismatase n=1 Tax=Streptomyces sp. NPDC102402 TaxID=3366169 RepID=UPI00380C0446